MNLISGQPKPLDTWYQIHDKRDIEEESKA